MANSDTSCPKCRGEGYIKEKDGSVHICFDCLNSGKLDQHGDKNKIRDAKDFGIKL
jgi:hypothetical protein